MPRLMLQCKNCSKIFSSGISMGPGSSATFISNRSQCPFCGSMENIPDGTFKATVEGFIQILEESEDPIQIAKELLHELQKVKTQEEITKVKELSKFEKLKIWLPNSPEKVAAYIAIIYTLIQVWTKNPEVHIEYNTFINQYNQTVQFNLENKSKK